MPEISDQEWKDWGNGKLPVPLLKRALVEVRELCAHTKCVACPLHKTEKVSSIPYCPLYENMCGMTVQFPNMWDIEDWKEDGNDENA